MCVCREIYIFKSYCFCTLCLFFYRTSRAPPILTLKRTKSAGKCDRVQITSRNSSKILTSVGQNSLCQRLILPTSFSEYFILPYEWFTIGS